MEEKRKMATRLQLEGISPEVVEALLASNSPLEIHGSRSIMDFQYPSSLSWKIDTKVTMDDDDNDFDQPEKKKRSLTPNQVELLEKSFEMENKLEPDRKIKLAKDLSLQPRQVAIWFQNRRARWKTKQLEMDYETLKLSYNNLKSDYENVLEEKEILRSEILVLTDKLLLRDKEMIPKQKLGSTSEEKKSEMAPTCKQEDISSANSVVFDSDSPYFVSHLMHPAVSTTNVVSRVDEDDEVENSLFASGFLLEDDHVLWF